jgi:type VI secretion system protein ImpJ
MIRTNRVVWQDGMLRCTQYVQQQVRWVDYLVRTRVQALRPNRWGLVACVPDRTLLGTGRFAVQSMAGAFEDGTSRPIRTEAKHRSPLDVPDSARNSRVFLALPFRQPGAVESAGAAAGSRRPARPLAAHPKLSAWPTSAARQVARRKDPCLAENDELTGVAIPLVRSREIAIEMSDVIRCAASIGPSPHAVHWPLPHSGRGLRI